MAVPTTLKTPGVYIDEKNAFPNSIVAVETAVPAFIGYTEFAEFGGQSLKNKPVRIESFMEFELFYGGGFTTTYDIIPVPEPTEQPKNYDFKLKGTTYLLKHDEGTKFNLYDALKFFYQNGGGSCFIVSVGTFYDKGADKPFTTTDPFMKGIDLLKKETVPTMLLAPDAVLFDKNDCYSLQEHMLMHCGDQMNRVAILDIFDGHKGLDDPTDNPVDNFRNQVSSDSFDYGAAYYPWLNTTIVQASEVNHKNLNPTGLSMLQTICTDAISNLKDPKKLAATNYIKLIKDNPPTITMNDLQAQINALPESEVINAVNLIKQRVTLEQKVIAAYALPEDTPNRFDTTQDAIDKVNQAKADFISATEKTKNADVKKLIGIVNKLNTDLGKAAADYDARSILLRNVVTDVVIPEVKKDIVADPDAEIPVVGAKKAPEVPISPVITIENTATDATKTLKEQLDQAEQNATDAYLKAKTDPIKSLEDAKFGVKKAQEDLTTAKINLESKKSDGGDLVVPTGKVTDAKKALDIANETLFIAKGGPDPSVINNALSIALPEYKLVIENILKKENLLPPAAALAGIYTLVDSQRGVWKAPANVSVSSVVSPAVLIDYAQQEDLNAPLQGKAICAIRPFIGLGTMVWGARTLDANSLDWRYINVRRTMIMLEQSIKIAAKAYVFEPNVKNTWVSIESMIENFLTNLWKLGALAGAVPTDAFSVTVGLGATMTANDILEGRMNITVRVAISHPAEFIVITFQQQQQKS